jgi:UDP-2,3-diacylglucosamine pyrophosphatase LpxH
MFHTHKTRVVRIGAFWKVERYNCGKWQTMRDLFSTRADARKAQFYSSQL